MPDPLLYLQAMAVSAGVSALLMLAIGWGRWSANTSRLASTRLNVARVVAISGGVAIGYYVLQLRPVWPPVNGLDRLLTLVLPAAICVELICGIPRVPPWLAWFMRMSLTAVIGRVLLHGSVYISGPQREWTASQAGATLTICGALAAVLWAALFWLSRRSPGVSIPLALALSIQSAGLAIMLAGYIKGGAASLPLAAALAATVVVSSGIAKRTGMQAPVGIGVVALFGLLFIGKFFGGISTGSGLAMLLAPLLCWATEIPTLRCRKPWLVGSLRLLLVAIPLFVVLVLAALDFQRHTMPLLGK